MSKSERLTKETDFRKVIHEGKRFASGPLALLVLPNDMPISRFGVAVKKRLGNAVARNKAKRLVREALRLNKHVLGSGCDVVAIPNSSVLELEFPQLLATVARLFGKIRGENHSCGQS